MENDTTHAPCKELLLMLDGKAEGSWAVPGGVKNERRNYGFYDIR